MTRTFTFTAPDGSKLTRRSRTREYTHAILYFSDGKWRLGSCCGRPDLVADRLEYWGRGSPEAVAVAADAQ